MSKNKESQFWSYSGFDDHCDVGRKYHEIIDNEGFEVANQNGIIHGVDAELIVLQYNTHNALLEAAKMAIDIITNNLGATSEWNSNFRDAVDKISAAIAKAEGK